MHFGRHASRSALASLIALAVAVAACGGSDTPDSSETSGARGAEDSPTSTGARDASARGIDADPTASASASSNTAAEHGDAETRAPDLLDRPWIVLVTIDTLRRDHLSCYGYFRETSPAIDALAAESVVFDRALAPMATTYPSHLSLMTGLHPFQHGRQSNADGARMPFASGDGVVSAARSLAAANYTTAAFVSSRVLAERTGINDGFEHYSCPPRPQKSATAAETTDAALAWLREYIRAAPVFLWIHLWDTHEPNEPERVVFETDDALLAWIRSRGVDDGLAELVNSRRPTTSEQFFAGADPAKVEQEVLLADLYNRYDSDVAAVDREVGRLLDALRTRGVADDAIIVLTADHGQSLGENRHFGHGTISSVNVDVPLIVRFPARAGITPRRDARPVSLVDVLPTVLGRLDFRPSVLDQVRGVDAITDAATDRAIVTQEANQFGKSGAREFRTALLTDQWKYIRGRGREQLFDLRATDGAPVDLSESLPDVLERLRAKLDAQLAVTVDTARGDEPDDAALDEALEELRALGYVDE